MRLQHSLHVPCRGVNHADFTADLKFFVASCEFSGSLIVAPVDGSRVTKVIDLKAIHLGHGMGSSRQDVGSPPTDGTFLVADMMRGGLWEVDATRSGSAASCPPVAAPTGSTRAGTAGTRTSPTAAPARSPWSTRRSLRVRAVWHLPGGGSPDMGGVTADGRQLWLSGRYNGVVYVIDTRTGRLLHRIRVHSGPHGLCVWPQPGRILVGPHRKHALTVLYGATHVRATRTDRRLILVAMAVAAVATLPTIDRQPLSWDESVTRSAAERSLHQLFGLLAHTDAPLGLYYLMMHGWVGLGRAVGIASSAGWLRLPSALAAIAAVGVLVLLVGRWFGPRPALLSGLLLAVHPMLTFYGQDARPYTLVTLSFLLATWALLIAVDRPTVGRLGRYAALVALTLYLHLFAGYAFAAHAMLVARAGRPWHRWALVAAAVLATVTPLALVARQQTGEVAGVPQPTAGLVWSVLLRMFGGGWLVAVLVALVILARPRVAQVGPRAVFLLTWLATPVLGLVLVGFLVPDLVARYGLVCVPAAVTVVCVVALRRDGPAVRALAALAVVVAGGTTVGQQLHPYKYEDFRAADDAMGDLARPGDAVMFFPTSMRAGFESYSTLEPDLRNVHDAALAPHGTPLATGTIGGVDRTAAQIASAFGAARTIFVLGDPLARIPRRPMTATDRAEWAALTSYRVAQTMHWGVVYLTVMVRAG